MLADLKEGDDGKELLKRLVQWADVVICNQVAAQLGHVDAAKSSRRNRQ